ncbi:MAG: C25 family cysteine peptidase, partial [Fidelibacterota bacterium]
MHLSKKLVLSTIILAWGWAEQPSAFRGLGPAELSSRPLPLSYQSLIESSYNLTRGQVSFQRGTYLIISADVYAPYITPLKEFKASQGFDVQVRSLAEIGYTAPEIKQYIDSELSDNPLLEYVLFIGDVDGVGEVPSFYYGPENDVSDQSYSHLRGDDLIPDVFVGRFSVDSISELAVLISKTIHYHRDPLSANPDWLNRALVVAGNYSNTLPIPVTPKWTSYWVKEELELSGYSSVDTVFYPPVQQGATLIRASIDQGVGLVNYRGWGDANGWHYPEFHVGDVGTLNNGWMTPVFTSFVCNANDFANNVDPCLGESILRSGTPSAPKGGVAIIGPSDLHTSTKYNNIINAYMYDAMLDNGVRE